MGNLVDGAVALARPTSPLVAINRSQLAGRIRPFVPDGDAMLLQPMHIGFAAQEPQQLIDDGFEVDFLGRDQGKAFGEVEAHLMAENRARASARTVTLLHALAQHLFQQIEILTHFREFRLEDSRLQKLTAKAYIGKAGQPAMAINGFVISGPDPGAVPGAST